MKVLTTEAIGWYGVLAVLLSFALVSFGLIRPQNFSYFFLNITGSAGIIIETYAHRDLQPMFLNITWLLIALVSFVRIFIY